LLSGDVPAAFAGREGVGDLDADLVSFAYSATHVKLRAQLGLARGLISRALHSASSSARCRFSSASACFTKAAYRRGGCAREESRAAPSARVAPSAEALGVGGILLRQRPDEAGAASTVAARNSALQAETTLG